MDLKVCIPLILLLTGCAGTPIKVPGESNFKLSNEIYFKSVRQLTHGGANFNPHWSPDQQWLAFENQGEGLFNPTPNCFQVYQMKQDGSIAQRISTGKGNATHAFFYPDQDRILFSSTISTQPGCPLEDRANPPMAWPIYNSYQLYGVKTDGRDLIPLEPGAPRAYQAEAAICKNREVIFTSNREPGVFSLNLYKTNLDSMGTFKSVRKLTSRTGYEGGAAFSKDCSKIVWHAYVIPETAKNEKSMFQKLVKEQHFVRPTQMEIWISDADGTNAQPLTQLKGISFSPSFTPDGKSVIFSSNFKNPKEKNFALYLINLDGTGLQQVTSGNESDQYPEFSPDGKLLAFSSKRNARDAYETNVFIAEWQSPPQKP